MPLQPGQVLAERYEILAHLGTGGMSAVYQARDRLVGETIAIKFVLPSISREPRLREKFKQEVLVARKLTHPNVVRIYDIGEHHGMLFISMELIAGRTVAEILSQKKQFAVEVFLELFHQFTSALAYIHSQNVLHRDIKPQNLMYDKDGVLKVMDFGIARDMASGQTNQPTRIGTPTYMSPELLKGAPLTRASDIYSAGILFYELLTGRKPFRKGTLRERMMKPVPRVSRLVRDIPAKLDDVIYRCLQIRPQDRFQSVEELISAASDLRYSRVMLSGTFSDLLQSDPPALHVVLPIFLRTVQQLAVIHSNLLLRPILTPTSIRWSEKEVQIKTVLAEEAQHTRAVYSKYLSFREFNEVAPTALQVEGDIYVIGFMFYEILLGRRLFKMQFAELHRENSDLKWLEWHGDPAKKATALQEILPGCPRVLSTTIEGMMQKAEGQLSDLATVEASFKSLLEELARKAGAGEDTVRVRVRRLDDPTNGFFPKAKSLAKTGIISILLVSAATGILGGGGWLIWKLLQLPTVPPTVESKDTPPVVSAQPSPNPLLPRVIDSGTGPMMLVPETEFVMGTDDGVINEAPRHTVKLPAFYIDKYEVTNRLYREFCDDTGRTYPPNPSWDSHYFDKADYPVMNVSWYDARAYAVWAGKRLPTEAEWELAARGPNGNVFAWGNEFRDNAANLAGAADGYKYTAPVGTFKLDVSQFGVVDMVGNVSEWIEDTYTFYSGNPQELPEGERLNRVVRGAGMDFGSDYAHLSSRRSRAPGSTAAVGFRCAADVQTILNVLVKQSK
jgi:serine/threonine protein kinase/formylglycine-generating enzyme required for sulfatase activity